MLMQISKVKDGRKHGEAKLVGKMLHFERGVTINMQNTMYYENLSLVTNGESYEISHNHFGKDFVDFKNNVDW